MCFSENAADYEIFARKCKAAGLDDVFHRDAEKEKGAEDSNNRGFGDWSKPVVMTDRGNCGEFFQIFSSIRRVYCARHLTENICFHKKDFEKLQPLVFNIANSLNKEEFERNMSLLQIASPEAHKKLIVIEPCNYVAAAVFVSDAHEGDDDYDEIGTKMHGVSLTGMSKAAALGVGPKRFSNIDAFTFAESDEQQR